MSRYFLYTFWCLVHERLMCLFIVCEIMFTTGESRAQMTQNNKHNKWLQFLAGENFSPKLLWRTPTFISEQIEVDNREAERKSLSTAKATSSTQWPQMYRSSDKILQLHCKRNRWREGTPTADPSKSDVKIRQLLKVTARGGGGVTPWYKLYRYVPPHRVGFLRRFGLKTGIHFAHFGLESGMVFEGTTEYMNVRIVSISYE